MLSLAGDWRFEIDRADAGQDGAWFLRELKDSIRLPGVLQSVPPLVDDAQELVDGTRRSWVVRNLMPPAAPPDLPVQSHDAAVLRNASPR